MGTSGIEQLLYLMDQAFEGDGDHSLLANLRGLASEDWRWVPPGGGRSVLNIVVHVGECKYAYENHAFGDGTMTWAPHTVPTPAPDATIPAIHEWLREGHRCLRESIAALDDDELARPRKTNWGEMVETRWIIRVMIEHDLYHGGEINHLRALRQGNDRWPWDQA